MEGKRNLEVTRLSLIDVSFEDDCLIPSPSGDDQTLRSTGLSENWNKHDCVGLFEADNGREGENKANLSEKTEQSNVSTEPSEPIGARRAGKCNLRKSLAWDNAFFTSEGVLDLEELAIVNKTFKKAEVHALPGIEEDLQKSVDSSSSLDSENQELQSLEVDLFGQAQASIQQSGNENDKASGMAQASYNAGSEAEAARNIGSSKDLELDPCRKMKSVPASRRHGISKKMPIKDSNEPPVRLGPIKVAVRNAEQKSSLMPPKILSRANCHPSTATAKMKSLASGCATDTSRKAFCGSVGNQRLVLPKKPVSSDSRSVTPRSTPSPRSSSSGSPHSTKKLSSFERSGSNSSGSVVNTPRTAKYKPESRNSDLSSIDSAVKPPLKTSTYKSDFRYTPSSTSRIPTSKFSSISPTSSLDSLSSDSSSSTSINLRPHDSKAGPHTAFPSSLGGEIASGSDQYPVGREVIERFNRRSGGVCQPAAANSSMCGSDNKSTVRSFKPSGLRMPSPKIGFFDSANIPLVRNTPLLEKSTICTSSGSQQSHSGLPSALPRNASRLGNYGGASKPKSSKLQRPATQAGNMKFNSSCTESPFPPSAPSIRYISPAQLQQLPNLMPKVSNRIPNTPKIAESQSGTTLKARRGFSDRIGGKNYLEKTRQVEVGLTGVAKVAPCSDLSAEECGDQTVLRDSIGSEREEDQVFLNATNTSCADHDELLNSDEAHCDDRHDSGCFLGNSERKNPISGMLNLKNDQVSQFENQDDGSGRLAETVNINMVLVTVLAGKKGFSLCQPGDLNKSDASESAAHNAETFVCDQKLNFLQGLPNPDSLPVSPTKVGLITGGRSPLAIKYSFCNTSGSCESEMESIKRKAIDKKERNSLAPPPFSSPATEFRQENVISRNFHEDEISKSGGDILGLRKENDFENCCNSSPVPHQLVFLH